MSLGIANILIWHLIEASWDWLSQVAVEYGHRNMEEYDPSSIPIKLLGEEGEASGCFLRSYCSDQS